MNIPKIDKKKIAQGFKSFFTKNFALKVIAFVFAMLLWGYVLTDQKPVREKDVGSVSTSFDGEAELIAQGFCIRGDRSEILPDVNVKVRTQITNYAYVTPSTVLASVSLRNISEAREYDLPIQASVTSSLGVVQSITPATVHVEIDALVTKTIPITTTFTGELPDGSEQQQNGGGNGWPATEEGAFTWAAKRRASRPSPMEPGRSIRYGEVADFEGVASSIMRKRRAG